MLKNKKDNLKKESFFKRNGATIILFAILIVGVLLLLYPAVSDYWNSIYQSQMIAAYDAEAAKMSYDEKEEIIQRARAWNGELLKKADRWVLSDSEMEEYLSILDITGTGIMGYISVPKASVSLPIYHTTQEKYLLTASGHIEMSSFPVGGIGTHAAISGHRGLPSARLFTDLDKLSEGDYFRITVLDRVFTYEADKISIVEPDDVDMLEIDPQRDYCTLVTCTPYAVNSHRLLIRGHRVSDYLYDKEKIPGDATKFEPVLVAPLVAFPILITLLIILILSTAGKEQKRKKAEKGGNKNAETNEKDN